MKNIRKMKSTIIGLLLNTLALFAPIKGLILLLTMMVGVDTMFAIYVSVKLNGIKSFKSTKLWNIVPKTFFYVSSVLVLFLVDTYVFEGTITGIHFALSKAATMFWVYNEVKSIDETSMKLGNRSMWSIITEMIRKYKTIKKDLNDPLNEKKPD